MARGPFPTVLLFLFQMTRIPDSTNTEPASEKELAENTTLFQDKSTRHPCLDLAYRTSTNLAGGSSLFAAVEVLRPRPALRRLARLPTQQGRHQCHYRMVSQWNPFALGPLWSYRRRSGLRQRRDALGRFVRRRRVPLLALVAWQAPPLSQHVFRVA